jgi:hypothetical protein
MKFMSSIFIMVFLLLFTMEGLVAKEIGVAWEFNEDGNSEGWETFKSLSDLTVSNGILKATVTGDWAQLVGPAIDLSAGDFGYIQLRMKAIGPESAVIYWKSDSTSLGFGKFTVFGDSAFYDYEIPIYKSITWLGQIQQITKITMLAQVGTDIEIDYIRIIRLGTRSEIDAFKPLRTILKLGEEIPLIAVVKNSGDEEGVMKSNLQLPEGFELIHGEKETDHGLLAAEESDTLRWTVRGNATGAHQIKLLLSAENDSVESVLDAPVTDTSSKLDKFFLSAWSPPSSTTEAYNYYADANFDMVLWLPPDEASVAQAEQNEMRYQLRAGSLLGEHNYLRAPENTRPEDLTVDDLAKLDGMIDQFKNKENVFGYYLTDEPNALAFENLGKVVNYLREKDPTRFSYINLFPTYANEEQLGTPTYDEHVEKFIDVVKPELLSYDHYHFFNGRDGGGYFDNLGIIRKWAAIYDLPFCNIIQAIGYDVLNWRIPTAAEHRWLVYSSLAYGAKGIVWFHWDHAWGLTASPKRDELYASIQQLNQEVNRLGSILINLKSTAVYHSQSVPHGVALLPTDVLVKSVSSNANLVVGLFKDEGDKDFIFLMNKDYNNEVDASVILNRQTENIQYFDVESNQWQVIDSENTPEGATFHVSLQPGGGKLFSIGDATSVEGQAPVTFPWRFSLKQNYPNPFNPATTIEYELAKDGVVKLVVFDMLGREAAVLVDAEKKAGRHKIFWFADQFSSGLYVCSLNSGSTVLNQKMIVLK